MVSTVTCMLFVPGPPPPVISTPVNGTVYHTEHGKNRQTDKQTDSKAEREKDRLRSSRQAERQIDRLGRLTSTYPSFCCYRQTNSYIYRQTDGPGMLYCSVICFAGSGLELCCEVWTGCQSTDSTLVTWMVDGQSVDSSYLNGRALEGGRR